MKLFLKIALFTLVVPGAVAVLVPLLLGGDRTVAGGAWLGLAVCLFALGVALYVRAVWDFAVLGKGTPAPIDAPKRLVVRGIYRYSRNPLYIAMLTLIAGWAALFGTVPCRWRTRPGCSSCTRCSSASTKSRASLASSARNMRRTRNRLAAGCPGCREGTSTKRLRRCGRWR